MWRTGELSLAYLTVDGASPVEHVEAAAAGGFDAAGVRIKPPTHLAMQPSLVGQPAECRRVRDACRKTGVSLLDAEVVSLTPDIETVALQAFVDTASELGFRFAQTVIDDTDASRAGDHLGRLAEIAGAVGLRVALEFMAFRPLENLQSALELIAAVDKENIGLVIDALHLARSGGTPGAVADIPRERIALAQLCDAPRGAPAFDSLAQEARTGRLHAGEGGLWLDELLDALPDGLPLSVEVPHASFGGKDYAQRAVESMAAVRAFLARRSR